MSTRGRFLVAGDVAAYGAASDAGTTTVTPGGRDAIGIRFALTSQAFSARSTLSVTSKSVTDVS
jgi:hypothetical protein